VCDHNIRPVGKQPEYRSKLFLCTADANNKLTASNMLVVVIGTCDHRDVKFTQKGQENIAVTTQAKLLQAYFDDNGPISGTKWDKAVTMIYDRIANEGKKKTKKTTVTTTIKGGEKRGGKHSWAK
jgi:hypothetical protein